MKRNAKKADNRPEASTLEKPEFEAPLWFDDPDRKSSAIEMLVGTARATQLILTEAIENYSESDIRNIASGLSVALEAAVNKVDILCFHSLGGVTDKPSGVDDKTLAYVLQEKLDEVRKRIHKSN